MKFFFLLIILILFQSCSFDNKTGIWKNINEPLIDDKGTLKGLKSLSLSDKTFNKKIPYDKNYKFTLTEPINTTNWKDIYYNQSNNVGNLKYRGLNKLEFRSKKVSRNITSENILLDSDNIILTDIKGNIIIFSLSENEIINKFNFYKKKYKKLKKSLNFIIEDNIIYVSDNFGYLYSYDYNNKKIVWAKNYKIPFRSNLKIQGEKIIAANQNNSLFFFNKTNGDVIKSIPTEETVIKNNFVNSISLSDRYTVFLNTYGSLYAIENKSLNINWFINLNQSLDINPSNLFKGSQILIDKNKIFISTNKFFYVLDIKTGSIIYRKNFSSDLKPIVINNHLFILTKNNFLISLDLTNGEYVYSYNLNQKIADFLNIKKRNAQYKNMMILNNKIFIFLKNSYILKLKTNGEIENILKFPSKIKTSPIVANSSILFLSSRNRLNIIN